MNVPARLDILAGVELEPVIVEAAVAEGAEAPKLRKFSMVAYTGGAMDVGGFEHPVVVDLDGLSVSQKARPILHQHDPSQVVGHTDKIEVRRLSDRNELRVTGVISGASDAARMVAESAANGFPWQASIGARVRKVDYVAEGQVAQANGRNFKGPVLVARAASLGEVSFVALGADDNTSARLAASAAETETIMADEIKDIPVAAAAEVPSVAAQIRAEAAKESERIAAIRKTCGDRHGDLAANAIREGWDVTRTELEVLRAERPVMGAPAIHATETHVTGEVLEAAIALSGKLPNREETYSEKALDAASKKFRGGLGLQRLLLEAAWANGYHGRDLRGNAAIRDTIQAAFSNRDFAGILSNAANKFLYQGFMAVEAAWRQIAAVRPVSDFKSSTSYRLSGDHTFVKVAPDGELQSGAGAEVAYPNKAETYGRMFSVTRQDIINDDLGALTKIPQQIGRGAGTGLNDIFWKEFAAGHGSFFTSGRGNIVTTSALGFEKLSGAEQKFLDQTGPDGNPLGVMPKILLVPSALKTLAFQLCNSLEVRDTTSSKVAPTMNPFAGQLTPVVSSYLGNANYGNSSTSWYLLADPADLAMMEVVFLNGVETPTVEEAEADFNVLGIQMRAYLDFGVAKHEYRAAVKATA